MAVQVAKSNATQEFIAVLMAISEDAKTTFGSLTAPQRNWKPSAEQWSVAQCFDHLITANNSYFPILEAISKGEKERTFWERVPILPWFFGNLLYKNLQPDSARKLKAPTKYEPSSSNLDAGIIDRFNTHQEHLSSLMQGAARTDLQKTIITSPALSFIVYSLYDAYRIIVVHEKRHFQQAKRVLESGAFPGL